MNEKSKARRAAYQARQEKQGKQVVNWIFGVLFVLAVCLVVWAITIVS